MRILFVLLFLVLTGCADEDKEYKPQGMKILTVDEQLYRQDLADCEKMATASLREKCKRSVEFQREAFKQ